MLIGELAEQAGTSTRMVRYYEQHGLLRGRRMANGYRAYDDADLRILREIRALLEIGFALEETRPFVECLRAGNPAGDSCADSVAVYRAKLSELDSYIDRLQSVREQVSGQLDQALARREPRCELGPDTPHDES